MTFDLTPHIEAIAARAKDRPSEFSYDGFRWSFLDRAETQDLFTPEEKQKLAEALLYARRSELGGRIFQTLLEDPEAFATTITNTVGVAHGGTGRSTVAQSIGSLLANQGMLGNQGNQAQSVYQQIPSDYMKNFLK